MNGGSAVADRERWIKGFGVAPRACSCRVARVRFESSQELLVITLANLTQASRNSG